MKKFLAPSILLFFGLWALYSSVDFQDLADLIMIKVGIGLTVVSVWLFGTVKK